VNSVGLHGDLTVTPETVVCVSSSPPISVVLRSISGGRKIEISADGGRSFVQPVYDFSPSGFLQVAIMAPITHIKFTGIIGDGWSIV
jgi:hypothetical protein